MAETIPQQSPASPDSRQLAGQRLIEVLAIVGLFFVAAGDPAPAVNEQHYLTRLKHYWEPGWCEGDLFLESPDAHLTIVLLAGWATRLASLGVVAWVGRLLAWGLLAWAWQRLSWTVIPCKWGAVLSAGLWLVGMREGHFAGEWVIGGVEAKCFAYVFVLLALNAWLQDRWRAAWVHLGIATALHALVGGWSVLILLANWLLLGKRRPAIVPMLPAMALGGAIGLLGVAPPIVMNSQTPPEIVAEANQIYVFDRLPHHLAPLSKPAAELAKRGGRHAVMLTLLIAAAWYARRLNAQSDEPSAERLHRLTRYAWGAVVLLVCGLLIEILLRSDPSAAAALQRYYWYRLSDIAAPMVVALAATHAINLGLQHRSRLAVVGLAAALGVVAAHLGPTVTQRVADPRPPADRSVRDPIDWQDVCLWARQNTEEDALFLTPRWANSFKWRAHRPEVANWKDIPQDAASIVEWRRRMYNIWRLPQPIGPRTRALALNELGADRLRELGQEYGARYVLTSQGRPVDLPIAYQNPTYVVYDLRE